MKSVQEAGNGKNYHGGVLVLEAGMSGRMSKIMMRQKTLMSGVRGSDT
jgi:hypothetical protein